LQVMVGASREQFERWGSLLECFGKALVLVGPVGQAAALKLALNQLIASMTAAFALSLGFVERHRVPVSRFMEILRPSALYAPTFDKKLPRMVSRDYSSPTFPAKHLAKDVSLFLEAARGQELETSSLESCLALLRSTLAAGLGDTDYSSLYEATCPERKR
jgi:3-hydroxyisobutyrate dehydrogenase